MIDGRIGGLLLIAFLVLFPLLLAAGRARKVTAWTDGYEAGKDDILTMVTQAAETRSALTVRYDSGHTATLKAMLEDSCSGCSECHEPL